ncbi:hypothetical protein OCF84_21530 (plasmid) [Shewanella xiamenensis]|uniref:Uncharacterized protein n=1 Tax=Shewanella xiamenensis TaxID=332186 RepID=A0ABT6UGB9_9GAMM|nr:hypothetical protein [Shewanella xiamenensis]MDI5832541.1 hypothetical protein [Shewanella xiamenensis]WHF57841.1 hypothetical protein OCF84_21530 [Shewanella xiamenensis]
MSNKNPILTTSIIESLPSNPRKRSIILKVMQRKAVRNGILALVVGFVVLGFIELTGQSPEVRGNRAAEDLFKKTNGTICTGRQQHSIDSSASHAFINRLSELCESTPTHAAQQTK